MEDFSMAKTVKKAIVPEAKTTSEPAGAKAAPVVVKAPTTKSKTDPSPKSKIHLMPATYEQIAQLAHKYWAERGHQDGHDEEDWLRAEQELRGKAS
jgi:hypothetical protein